MNENKGKRTFTCIICPNGCTIDTTINGEEITVAGNKCEKGEKYVKQELIDPRRTIATTVTIDHAELPLCSVRITNAIPKKAIMDVMKEIRKIHLTAPVHIGQIVLHNVCGYESDVIVTKEMPAVK